MKSLLRLQLIVDTGFMCHKVEVPLSIVIGNVRLRDSEPSSVVLRLLTPVQSIQNKIKQMTVSKKSKLSRNRNGEDDKRAKEGISKKSSSLANFLQPTHLT